MKSRLRPTRSALVFGGVGAWGLLLISCVAVNRTLVAPPSIPGATLVGNKGCVECHEETTAHFGGAAHDRIAVADAKLGDTSCESCHGPGSIHVKAGGAKGTIVNPGKSPDACFQCHVDKRGEFALPHAHPAGHVTCTDCHDPHRGDAIIGGGTRMAAANETCLKCHEAQRGPYVFEHEALRDNCTACHNPHGSVNAKMLKARNATLCLQCHFQQQTTTGLFIGGRDHSSYLVQRGTCWSAGCHEAVHGSHVSSSLRF